VSVVVPTHNRPKTLANCIDSLLRLHYPQFEIIIVDNVPSTSETATLVQETYQHVPYLRYVREDALGASCARNRGIQEAQGEIIAFTDDDVIVDEHWLTQCVRALQQSKEIVCVTGYTLPLELKTPAQIWFEDASWIEHSEGQQKFVRRFFDKKIRYRQFYRGSFCGHSANMAARTDFLRSMGGFDIVLGAGMPAMGGEDLAIFLQVIMHQKVLAYEPSAIVHHLHRREYDKLRQQVYGYGVGYIAYIIHMLLLYPVLWIDLLTKIPVDILRLTFSPSPKTEMQITKREKPVSIGKFKGIKKSTHYPRELTILQFKGFLYGPIAYLKSRKMAKTIRRQQR
jgi:glycosyltransferase involved in cell wall biosynthesis